MRGQESDQQLSAARQLAERDEEGDREDRPECGILDIVTLNGHYVAMKDPAKIPRIGVAAFKAQLSRYLRAAQTGAEISIYDRNTPIARVGPPETGPAALSSRPARRSPSTFRGETAPKGWSATNSSAALDAGRQEG